MQGAPPEVHEAINRARSRDGSGSNLIPPPCYSDAILEVEQFLALDIPEKQFYLHPWLTEQSIFMISAWRGAGKTGWVLGILDAITKGKAFGPWQPGTPVNCLYIDGEMAVQDVMKRLNELGTCQRQAKLFVYSDSYAHSLGLPKANLLDGAWQEGLRAWMKDQRVKVWVVDNLASLSGGIDENSREQWDPIGKFLLSLRFDGITTGIIHHDGKTGVQRGTSAREDHCDVCIGLKKPSDYRADQGARFVATFTKSRIPTEHLPLIADTEFQFMRTTGDVLEWAWKGAADAMRRHIIKHLDQGMSQSEVASLLNTTKGWVSKVRAEAIKEKLLTEKNKLTPNGFDFAGKY